MALKMRKDIKKSSYYVWFLGAQESKGLRGSEYVVPVVKSLIARERNVEPFKVTLQVSHKGLKIVQNVPQHPQTPKSKKPEIVKHFIPHHAVTCVLQDVDIVSCILLLYNPVTKCPVHVHAYRCDSVETAEILKGQLQTLIERPENQKKLSEIETRLQAKGLLLPAVRGGGPTRRVNSGGGGSDGRSTSTRESESSSSSERLSGNQERITNLYDSLAAELREKLGSSTKRVADAPILLPPRDYDTVHRQKGNLTAIDLRRCMNANIVGVNVKKEGKTKVAVISSGGSSGIGSDHAPSPDQADPDQRYLDNQSTSDEEWTEQPSEDSLFLVQPGTGWPRADLSLPRARRLLSTDAPSTPSTPSTPSVPPVDPRRRAEIRQRTPSPTRLKPKLYPLKTSARPSNPSTIGKLSPRDRFKDAKEKFLLLEEMQHKTVEVKKRGSLHETPISPVSSGPPRLGRTWSRGRDSEDELEDRPAKDYVEPCEDDIFEHGYPKKNGYKAAPRPKDKVDRRPVEQYEDRGKRYDNRPAQYQREEYSPERKSQQYSPERTRQYDSPERKSRQYGSPERKPRYSPEQKARYSPERRAPRREYSPERVLSPSRNPRPRHPDEDYVEPSSRYRGSRAQVISKLEEPEVRYRAPPAPRRQDSPEAEPRRASGRNQQAFLAMEKKRRSMFDVMEDERRRSSNELAKEFKRRSYQEGGSEVSADYNEQRDNFDASNRRSGVERREQRNNQSNQSRHNGYQEIADQERFPGLDRESARHVVHNKTVKKVAASGGGAGEPSRYRHSYAEPGMSHHDVLHRTNSSVSSGRVGIAAIHPY